MSVIWFDPAAPPATIAPPDVDASAGPATDLALAQIEPWLDWDTNVVAMLPMEQFRLYNPDISVTSYSDAYGAQPDPNTYTDVPNPPRPSEVQAQADAMLAMIQDYLPGAP